MGWTKHEQSGWLPQNKGLITLSPILLLRYLLLISLTSPVFKKIFLFNKIFFLLKIIIELYIEKTSCVFMKDKKNRIL